MKISRKGDKIMRAQKRSSIISFLLIFSLLISPFSGLSITASATEADNENKLIKNLQITLKNENTVYYAKNGVLTSEFFLDESDVNITATDEDGNPVDLTDSDIKLTTNIDDISAKSGEDQEIIARITYNDGKDYLDSTNNPKVTIMPSVTKVPSKIKLKLKDEKTVFYAANDALGLSDTLDEEDDLQLIITYSIKYLQNPNADGSDQYASAPPAGKDSEEDRTIDLPSKEYTVKTNVNEVRAKAGKNQELKATLTYKIKDSNGNEADSEPIISTDNPKVNILPSKSEQLTAIKIELEDSSKKFYVDNGYMEKNKILSMDDIKIIGTYEIKTPKTKIVNDVETDEYEYTTTSTIEKTIPHDKYKDYTIDSNIETVSKVIFYNKKTTPQAQDVTVTLSYKNAEGTMTTLPAASVKVTILEPEAVNGVVTIEPQNIYYGSTGSNKNGVRADDNKNDKFDIQCALDMASADHKLIVHFPAGNYYISNSLYIHSNTTLKLDAGATIIRNSNSDSGVAAGTTDRLGVNHNILKIAPYNSTTTNSAGGYTNGENITIEGGTFDGGLISAASDDKDANLLNLGHASNITIKNSTIKNCYGNHLIELCAVQNAEISGCTFTGFRKRSDDPSGDQGEAIQIDVAHKDSQSAWTSAYKTDDTACININIHDNIFTDYPVAIGNHHSLAGHHHSNITIANNAITGTTTQNSGIKLYGCDNSVAKNNIITNCATGIKASESTGFIITDNRVTSSDYGIIDTDSSQGQITNNAMDKMANEGIIVYGSGTIADTISNNIISNSSKHGIIVHTGATCQTLTKNTIANCSSDGIQIYGSANAPSITSNTITGCGSNGIYAYSSAIATTIKSNKISDCNKYGVYVTGKASVKTLSSNTIKNTKKNGIYVKNDKIKVTFKSNKLTRVGSTAIKIDSKLSSKKKQKYTFAPKVISLNLKGGVMTTQASNLKKIKLKVGSKSYTKSTKKKKYTFKFKKYKKAASSATVTFTDKNKNTVARVLDLK